MDAQFDAAVKDAVLTGNGYFVDVHVHLRRDDLRNLIQHTHTVDASQTQGGVEEENLVHVPLDVNDTVSEAGLELGCNRTVAPVNLYLVFVVDIT